MSDAKNMPTTPSGRPWRYDGKGAIEECHGQLIVIDKGMTVANAEFIVRAVNTHDDLVDAVRWLLQLTDALNEDGIVNEWMASLPDAGSITAARAALAKAAGN